MPNSKREQEAQVRVYGIGGTGTNHLVHDRRSPWQHSAAWSGRVSRSAIIIDSTRSAREGFISAEHRSTKASESFISDDSAGVPKMFSHRSLYKN